MIDRFLRPFFAGIFFDKDLSTTSRLFDLVFKQLALGDNALPAAGIASIPLQIADRLPQSSIRLNTRVVAVDPVTSAPASVTLENGDIITADLGVIVAVDQPEAKRLLPQAFPSEPGDKIKRPPRSTTCLYFSADRAAIKDPILILNGSGKGIVNNMFFVTNVAPSYAPKGKVLVSVSLVGAFPDRSDEDLTAEVVRELGEWFGDGEVSEWKHLRTYRIGFAQPNQTPPTDPIGRDPRVDDGVYMCGDHWSWATFDGALVAGRRAAEAMVRDRKISAV
ncbi:uncharacterized protein [Typha angustifolia]|uniref:uncharacterized protein n=1 Tax=Typha angustifolia TaxID=59011 RepID=UPI003C2D5ACC